MNEPAIRMACAGCGAAVAPEEPYPFRCAQAQTGDDIDHVLSRTLDVGRLVFPAGDEPETFVRYRALTYAHALALAGGMSDEDYVDVARYVDRRIAAVDGRGFRETPFARNATLSEHLGFSARGGVWIKDETGNVAGSHKARHLMGIALELEVVERLALVPRNPREQTPRLAIASCGNAALAAAVVARAVDRPLAAFVPPEASPAVVHKLRALRATVSACPRREGERGDPCTLRLRESLESGTLPFTCQGNENGLAIEGGQTLAFEMISALGRVGIVLERLYVQVGGGALASACVRALREARMLGVEVPMPRIHAVQTQAVHPLSLAWDRLLARLGSKHKHAACAEALEHAARHRSEFMWPWDGAPASVASGMLDDQTYDWLAVVRGMLESGGAPVLVSEDELLAARLLAHESTGIRIDATGSAGLAGLMQARRREDVGADERVAVLFTGVER